MENKFEELGAVTVEGRIVYELLPHDENHVKLQHTQNLEQYIIIHKDALRAISSILTKAALRLGID